MWITVDVDQAVYLLINNYTINAISNKIMRKAILA